jgi:hypothetical protein
MTEADVPAALRAEGRHANFLVSVSDRQIAAKYQGGHMEVLDRIARMVPIALDAGLTVSVGAEDASRADTDFLQAVIDAVESAGGWRFRIAGTLGMLDPFATEATFRHLRAQPDAGGGAAQSAAVDQRGFGGGRNQGLAQVGTVVLPCAMCRLCYRLVSKSPAAKPTVYWVHHIVRQRRHN